MPRVLVADDQSDILHALRLLLAVAGCEADLVGSVEEVVASVGRRAYDLLLVDLNYTRDTTSGREGLDLIARVHGQDAALPIVVMTGWGTIDTAVEAMRRGARSFVQKPWDDTTLVEVVRREIDNGRAVRRRDAAQAREHEDARAIQRALLPAGMPVMPGCTLAATWTPALELGGDCYDMLRVSDTRVAVSIADVVGKGLPAALLMANFQAAVRAFATADLSPAALCEHVNDLLFRSIEPGKFVTFCYAVLDVRARSITYANAGHNPPVLFHHDGRVDRLAPTGRVLGVTAGSPYTTGVAACAHGDRFVLFTDGITEARSPAGEEFGDDRLIDLIGAFRDAAPDAITGALTDAVADWTAGSARDDATLIVAAIG